MYPYLLPKSTSTADQLSFTIPGGQCATVQVRPPLQPVLTPPSLQPRAPGPRAPPLLGSGTTAYSLFRQVLRSVDRWSAGTMENSILNAYLHTIRESQRFLYIEV